MRNKDIVVVGLQPWDIEVGSNCKNIALELARDNRVLYVNRALDRITSIRQRSDDKVNRRIQSLKGSLIDLEQIQSGLWVLNPRVILESVNWMPSVLFDVCNKINNRRLASAILNACGRLGFENIILFIDNDFFRAYHLPELLHARFSVYYIRDYLIEQPYFAKHGAKMESGLMRKANLVVANSSYLADFARKFNANSFDIGQGCDFSIFQPDMAYPKPEDLKNIPGPVIGYVGALVSYRLDLELLVKLAKAKPEWSWVFVGPEDQEFRESSLHSLTNVYFLGSKDAKALPAYIHYFDVCLNPQQVNKITLGNYPRKVDEYLAMGKPVVATYTDFMNSFKGYVYLCRTDKEYIESIQLALAEVHSNGKATDRRNFALTHTWENSVGKLYEKYEQLNN